MRLGIDARPLQHPYTGIGQYLRALLKELDHKGVDLYLYASAPFADPPASAKIRTGKHFRSKTASLFAQAIYPGWTRKVKLDCFWSPRHHLPLALPGIASVVTIHDLVWRTVPLTMTAYARTLERLLMPPSIKMATAVLAVSTSTARDLVDFDPKCAAKVTVTPLAPRLAQPNDKTALLANQTTPYALFVGTLEPRKNIERLLDAFRQARIHGNVTHQLHLVGSGGWKHQRLMSIIRQYIGEGWLTHLGELADEALTAQYANADFLVYPSLYEGFGLPLLEAMHYGVPAVTSKVSSMPDIAQDSAILVDPENTQAISHAIESMANHTSMRLKLGERAKSLAKQYSWRQTAEKTYQVFEQVTTSY